MSLSNVPDDHHFPDWDNRGKVHEWKNHISSELQAIWGTFTGVQRAVIAQSAQEQADAEEWD